VTLLAASLQLQHAEPFHLSMQQCHLLLLKLVLLLKSQQLISKLLFSVVNGMCCITVLCIQTAPSCTAAVSCRVCHLLMLACRYLRVH
jgi:hypothetical protein